MKNRKSGKVCSAKYCNNKSYNCKKKFHAFPKRPDRARVWVANSGRKDFLDKIDVLYKKYRLCDDHFEARMYTNHLREGLNTNAVPTLFASSERSAKDIAGDHTYAKPLLRQVEVSMLENGSFVPVTPFTNAGEEDCNQSSISLNGNMCDCIRNQKNPKGPSEIVVDTKENSIVDCKGTLTHLNETVPIDSKLEPIEEVNITHIKTEMNCEELYYIEEEICEGVEICKEELLNINEEISYDFKLDTVDIKMEPIELVHGFIKTEIDIEEDTNMLGVKQNYEEDTLDVSSQNEVTLKEKEGIEEEIFKRPQCDKIFKKQYNKIIPPATYSTNNILKCGLCERTYSSLKKLKKHAVRHRDAEKYICEVCEKNFPTKAELHHHLQSHSNERNFKCDLCDKAYFTNKDLSSHRRIHLDNKYKCSECDKEFKRNYDLKRHKVVHTKERLIECEICNKSFSRPSSLKQHNILRHKVIPCPLDLKGTLKRNSLKIDGKTPSEDIYECQYCGKGFAIKDDLLMHEQQHGGERPYTCNICSKTYRHKLYLTRHLKTHNK